MRNSATWSAPLWSHEQAGRRRRAGGTGALSAVPGTVGVVMATLAVGNYRSLRRLVVPLAELNVVTGANGTGKSSLYRALRLLADAARNGAVAALAREGGLSSTLWAGPEKTGRSVREGRHPVQGTVRTGCRAFRLWGSRSRRGGPRGRHQRQG